MSRHEEMSPGERAIRLFLQDADVDELERLLHKAEREALLGDVSADLLRQIISERTAADQAGASSQANPQLSPDTTTE